MAGYIPDVDAALQVYRAAREGYGVAREGIAAVANSRIFRGETEDRKRKPLVDHGGRPVDAFIEQGGYKNVNRFLGPANNIYRIPQALSHMDSGFGSVGASSPFVNLRYPGIMFNDGDDQIRLGYESNERISTKIVMKRFDCRIIIGRHMAPDAIGTVAGYEETKVSPTDFLTRVILVYDNGSTPKVAKEYVGNGFPIGSTVLPEVFTLSSFLTPTVRAGEERFRILHDEVCLVRREEALRTCDFSIPLDHDVMYDSVPGLPGFPRTPLKGALTLWLMTYGWYSASTEDIAPNTWTIAARLYYEDRRTFSQQPGLSVKKGRFVGPRPRPLDYLTPVERAMRRFHGRAHQFAGYNDLGEVVHEDPLEAQDEISQEWDPANMDQEYNPIGYIPRPGGRGYDFDADRADGI